MKRSGLKALQLLFTAQLILVAHTVKCQNLPGVQKGSMYTTNIKVDGVATELGNNFKAFNKATDIYYTMANDEDNLYLIVQTKYNDITDKILRGGITLTISQTKNKKEFTSITFPDLNSSDESLITNMFARKVIVKREKKGADVEVDDLNKTFEAHSKLIKIFTNKENADAEISVYNEEGIRAASKFNSQLVYTYELSVPIKFLSLPANGAEKFSYNIKINPPADNVMVHGTGPPSPPIAISSTAPTDFSGEYILAVK